MINKIYKLAQTFFSLAKNSLFHIDCGGSVIFDPHYYDPEMEEYICSKCHKRISKEEITQEAPKSKSFQIFTGIFRKDLTLEGLELHSGDIISSRAITHNPEKRFEMLVNNKEIIDKRQIKALLHIIKYKPELFKERLSENVNRKQ